MAKFASELEELFYVLTLSGTDESLSFLDGANAHFVAQLRHEGPFADFSPSAIFHLSEAERKALRETAAFVLFERSDGIVEIVRFDDAKAAAEDWANFKEKLAPFVE